MISAAEVTNISRHGFWILLDNRALFPPFEEFPWLEEAPVGTNLKVERPQYHHPYSPDFDVDLTIDRESQPVPAEGEARRLTSGCGDLTRRFAYVIGDAHRTEYPLAFSCSCRGFCPSCAAKQG